MPAQNLARWTAAARTPASAPPSVFWRRVVLFSTAFVLAALADYGAWDTFSHDGVTPLEIVSLILFTALCGGISIWFTSSLAGFVMLMRGDHDDLGLTRKGAVIRPQARTAVILPVRNEDPTAVFARLARMDAALAEQGVADRFDHFVLSDTNLPEVIEAEEAAMASFRHSSKCAAYYRRRAVNTERKAGNVADWVRRFGAAYETMIVLDADSLMSGETMVRLASAIERNPDVGVIQTMPAIVGGQTFFARWLQFCTRLYGQVAATGLAWWTGSESVYWGHNAAIRVRAFAAAAGLPQLNAPGVFGGTILSHDAIEAALMRRQGWGVHLAPMLEGSFEESPPTLTEFAARDRRWCQGNVQHIPLLRTPGMHWVSRLQLFIACMGYMTSPLWLMFMTIGLFLALTSQKSIQLAWKATMSFVDKGWTPPANAWDFFQTIWLLALTTTLLLGPKFLGCIYILSNKARRETFGGGRKLMKGLFVELFVSCALAPIMMVTQTRGLIEILLGRDAGWRLQNRTADGLSWDDALRQYRWHMVAGAVLGLSVSTTPSLILWMLPVVGPLLFSPVLARWTSGVAPGAKARAEGLFLIPEEVAPAAASMGQTVIETRGAAFAA